METGQESLEIEETKLGVRPVDRKACLFLARPTKTPVQPLEAARAKISPRAATAERGSTSS